MRTKPYSASGRDRGWSWGMLASVWIACAGRFIGGMPAGILSLRNTSGGTRRGTLSLLCCGHGGWLRLPCEGWCRTLCGCTVSLLPCAGGGLATAGPVEVHSPFSFSLLPCAGGGWLRLPREGCGRLAYKEAIYIFSNFTSSIAKSRYKPLRQTR